MPQNPGISGLEEFTSGEKLFLQNLAGLSYVAGDILYYNGTNLTRLPIGSADQFLRVNAGATAPEWDTLSFGSGTVTSVSVVTANGVSGSVATSTTTPAITLTLGAITPSAIQVSGLTASEIVITDASKNLVSAAVATYPSLTELTYLKGVTSAIQTQINAKQASDTQLTSLAALSYAGNSLKVVRLNVGETDFEFATVGAGDVSKVGTPVNNQVGVWTGDGTIEGDAALTFDTTTDTLSTVALNLSGLTASEIVITDASKNIVSAPAATYPSLTELTYVKGATSALQTQLNAKQATITFGTGVQTAIGVNVGSAGAPVLFDGAGGTPSSLTLTNATGLPIAGLVASTSTALGVGSIELGHATDTTITRVSAGVVAIEGANILVSGGALGTPASGTLTNATGLPVAGITSSTSTALGVGSLELGHASDTTLSRSAAGVLAVEGVVIPSISSTNTITNKRNQPRIVSAASYTTDTGTSLDVSTTDIFVITAQAGALLFNAPGGTPVQGERLVIRIKDNGTARALTWNAVFRAMGTALPSTTVLSKTLYLGFFYNSTDTKWDLVASAQEA